MSNLHLFKASDLLKIARRMIDTDLNCNTPEFEVLNLLERSVSDMNSRLMKLERANTRIGGKGPEIPK